MARKPTDESEGRRRDHVCLDCDECDASCLLYVELFQSDATELAKKVVQ